jgi:hypothetical protein
MGGRNTLIFEERWSVGMNYRRRIYYLRPRNVLRFAIAGNVASR